MLPEEKFKEIATASKAEIENFNDTPDDKAIAWAYDEIKRLGKLAYLAEGLRITNSEDMGIFLHFETVSGQKSGLRLDKIGVEWALEKLAKEKIHYMAECVVCPKCGRGLVFSQPPYDMHYEDDADAP